MRLAFETLAKKYRESSGDGVVGTGAVTPSTANAGCLAGHLDDHDGVGRLRCVGRRSHTAQLHRGACRAAVQVCVHDVVFVVSGVVLLQRHHTWNSHDNHLRTWLSGQYALYLTELICATAML